jgi:anaerobic C4-dicarboxylate transporter
MSAVVIVLLGLIPALRPIVETAKGLQPLSMSAAIQITMLSFACLIVLCVARKWIKSLAVRFSAPERSRLSVLSGLHG